MDMLSAHPNPMPAACLPLFDWTEDEWDMILDTRSLAYALPLELREIVLVGFFDFLQRCGVCSNAIGAVRTRDFLKPKALQIYRDLAAALRTGNEEVIRQFVHGGSFQIEIAGGTAILSACEPPPSLGGE